MQRLPVVAHLPVEEVGRRYRTCPDPKEKTRWHLITGKERGTLRGHKCWVHGRAFSPDGRTLASAGGEWPDSIKRGELKLWDLATGKECTPFPAKLSQVFAVAFSPDGRTLATGQRDAPFLKLWDVATGRERAALPGHKSMVGSVAFSPDGKTLASASWDGKVKLWDLDARRERATIQDGRDDSGNFVVFRPGGQQVVTPGRTMQVMFWNALTGRGEGTLPIYEARDPFTSINSPALSL